MHYGRAVFIYLITFASMRIKKKVTIRAANLIVKEKGHRIGEGKKEVKDGKRGQVAQELVEKRITSSSPMHRLSTFGTNNLEKAYQGV